MYKCRQGQCGSGLFDRQADHAWAELGPPGAQVTDLEFNEVELENLDYFDVRPTS